MQCLTIFYNGGFNFGTIGKCFFVACHNDLNLLTGVFTDSCSIKCYFFWGSTGDPLGIHWGSTGDPKGLYSQIGDPFNIMKIDNLDPQLHERILGIHFSQP